MHNRRISSGFSLVEAAIVLGVIGLVIGGIWVAASAVQDKMRINTLLDNVSITYGGIQTLYGNQPFADNTQITGVLLEAVAPKGQVKFNQLVDPWDNSISIRLRTGGGTVPRHVEILFDFHGDGGQRGITYCMKLAPLIAARFRATGATPLQIPSLWAADESGALHTLELAEASCYAITGFHLRLPL